MLTWTEMKKEAADLCGLYEDSREMAKIAADINTGIKMFNNAARRYWTRKEKTSKIVAGISSVKLPGDLLRVSELSIDSVPLIEIHSEKEWLCMNSTKSSGRPSAFFIKDSSKMELYPAAGGEYTLKLSYEPRMADLCIEDFEIITNVKHDSDTITGNFDTDIFSKLPNQCYTSIDGGYDGFWYKIIGISGSNSIKLERPYTGVSKHGLKVRIGQCPTFPEEFHHAPVYFAAQQFFLMRKDLESSSMYKQLYDNAYNEYRRVYGDKTTGGVINVRASGVVPRGGLAFPRRIG